eukprot:GFUD01034939.1.p1 GENE.GFUD01034939.1~~GFUD01034939.1.p1  ORF type:complete len:152 (-),score=45.88 GFUD01034939.1:71-526(-)
MRITNHPKVEVVSCFRSTGSMPVPKPVTMILPNYLPHRERNKRKVLENSKKAAELVFKHATIETTEEVQEETVNTFNEDHFNHDSCDVVSDIDIERSDICKVTSVNVLQCDPEPPSEPKPKQKDQQSCKKHSRCHCDLMSLETADFFTIKV